MTRGEDAAANLFQKEADLARLVPLSDTITISCPMEAQIGIVDLPQGWSPGLYPRYHFKFISITTNAENVSIFCSYAPKEIEGGWTMVRTVPATYSCQVPSLGYSSVICKLKPPKPLRKRKS